MYTVEEKQKIDYVAEVFQEYLRHTKNEFGQPKYELLWMDNLQCYLFVINYNETAAIAEEHLLAYPIYSAQELYIELIDEIIGDVYSKHGFLELSTKDITEDLIEQAQEKVLNFLEPYMKALPEYQELTIKTISLQRDLYTKEKSLDELVNELLASY